MHYKEGINNSRRLFALLSIALISSVLMLMVSAIAIAEEQAATISVSKTVTGDPNPGSTLTYQIVIAASGSGSASLELMDSLPADLPCRRSCYCCRPCTVRSYRSSCCR